MKKRIPLSFGTIIKPKCDSSYTYVIERVIGDGASSIVYDAYYLDNSNHKHWVRLKECYPYHGTIQRVENELVWSSESDRTNDISAFEKGYDSLMKNQKSNYIVHAFDQFECNNTMYIVMDANNGLTFDKTNFDSLKDILTTVKLLAYVVGEYHQNGYLHLDIKPSNFLVYPRPSEHIVLFDTDSITLIDDIRNEKIKCVSCSKGWAAPEQMQGQTKKFCPATDIYSIGAILFQTIMGRAVTNNDIGIFANWDFEGKLFEKINPKIKRLLCEAFHKTLSANIKRRYQSVEGLINILDEAIKVSEEQVYIRSSYPKLMNNFIGREKELAEIAAEFQTKDCVIIHGFMGMGKSSLAIAFSAYSKSNYDKICWVKVNNPTASEKEIDSSIRQALNSNIINFSNNELQEDQFIKLLDSRVLVIIDNYDVDRITPYVSEILNTDCKVLITTRTNLNVSGSNATTITLKPLKKNELVELIQEKCGRSLKEDELIYIQEFLEAHEYLTYSIILSAGQMYASCISLQEKLEDVYMQQNDETVELDGEEDTLINHYRKRAQLESLSEIEKECLRTVFVMSYNITPGTRFVDSQNGVLDRAVFKSYTGISLNTLNKLIKRNLIFEDESGELSLHSSIKILVERDWEPTCENCPSLYAGIKKYLDFQPDMSLVDIKEELLDIYGVSHQKIVQRTKELFDIYYYICEEDLNKTQFLINLFLLFTKQNMTEEYASDIWFVEQYEDIDIWHFDWDRRNWYAYRLFINVLDDDGLKLFDDCYYKSKKPPKYDCSLRAIIYLAIVFRSTLRFIHSIYYREASGFLILLCRVFDEFLKIRDSVENKKEYLEAAKCLIDICLPMFEWCFPFFANEGYAYWIDEVYKMPFGDELNDTSEYPNTISPLCIHKSLDVYELYVSFFKILSNSLEDISKYGDMSDKPIELAWKKSKNAICAAINRLCIGYEVFYDFLNPMYQKTLISEKFPIEDYYRCQELYENGFDEDSEKYVEEILQTVKATDTPFYLYKSILNPRFPMSNVAYDMLVEADFGENIFKDKRLSKLQKRKLYEEVFWYFIGYEDDWDTNDAKGCFTDKEYYLLENGKLAIGSNSRSNIEVSHHIVLLWYQILTSVFNEIELSKQFLTTAHKEMQSKYLESLISVFDYELYQEYGNRLIANIPEFSCPMETVLYELFTKNQPYGKTSDSILANVFYNLSHGLPLIYEHNTIIRAIKKYIENMKSYGKEYNPFDNELLEYWHFL